MIVLRSALLALALVAVLAAILAARLLEDTPRSAADSREHFMYGSTGGDRLVGIPVGIWNALPELCSDYMPEDYEPGSGLRSLGFLYEDGREHPIGTSSRRHAGFDRTFLN